MFEYCNFQMYYIDLNDNYKIFDNVFYMKDRDFQKNNLILCIKVCNLYYLIYERCKINVNKFENL